MTERFQRQPLPPRFCRIDRLCHALEARGLDGIVVSQQNNLFYLSGLNPIAHKSDEPRPYALLFSRHAPEHPVLVLADYYLGSLLSRPSWVEDVRPYRAVMMPLDLPPAKSDIDRFIPEAGRDVAWVAAARERYSFDFAGAVRGGLADLRLDKARVAFDDPGFAMRLGLEGLTPADGYDVMMFARAVKSPTELDLLRRATRLNEQAIRRTVAAWQPGITWAELAHAYACAVAGLGGFVHDPGGMVWGHPRGAEDTITLQTGLEHGIVEEGSHVMFDCHGSLDLYCWDGGKTWVVGGEPKAAARPLFEATARVAEDLLSAMRPGVRISALQARARDVYRKAGAGDADRAVIFFHGLGLSHMDIEQRRADGTPNGDWMLEEGMVVPMHLLWPGGADERVWLEEVVAIGADGGEPLFSWGFEPMRDADG